MFRFLGSLKAIKRQWARFGLSFSVLNIIKIIIFAPRRKTLASGILAMPLNFFLFRLKDFFLLTGTKKGTNTFTWKVQQILGNLHRRKRYISYPKDLYFLCRKTLPNGRELHQERYLSMRRLSNLSPFGNLSDVVMFFSFRLTSFQAYKAYEYYGSSRWKPRFHHIKTTLC